MYEFIEIPINSVPDLDITVRFAAFIERLGTPASTNVGGNAFRKSRFDAIPSVMFERLVRCGKPRNAVETDI